MRGHQLSWHATLRSVVSHTTHICNYLRTHSQTSVSSLHAEVKWCLGMGLALTFTVHWFLVTWFWALLGLLLCPSYKLWYNYLKLRRKQVRGKCVTDPVYEEVNNAFERALVFLHKVTLHGA